MDSSIIVLSDDEKCVSTTTNIRQGGTEVVTEHTTTQNFLFFTRDQTEKPRNPESPPPNLRHFETGFDREPEKLIPEQEMIMDPKPKQKRKRLPKIRVDTEKVRVVETEGVKIRMDTENIQVRMTEKDLDEPSTSHGVSENVPPKKKRRTKEEIEAEKREKERARIKREMETAKNSKAEKYLFCYVNETILAMDDLLNSELTARFAERSLSDQLVVNDDKPDLIYWKRKRIELHENDVGPSRLQYMDLENAYVSVLDGSTFLNLIKKDQIMDYIETKLKELPIGNPELTIIVFGQHGVKDKVLHPTTMEAFEKYRVQFRFVTSPIDFSYLVVQLHRALAKIEKKLEIALNSPTPLFQNDKGNLELEGPELVKDWWYKMLGHVFRMSNENIRAIVAHYPDPVVMMDELLSMEPGQAMAHLANIKAENERKVGPVLAQRLYKMLTETEGDYMLHG